MLDICPSNVFNLPDYIPVKSGKSADVAQG